MKVYQDKEHVTASGALTKGSAVVANSDGTASLPFNTKKVFNEGTSTTTAIATNGSGTFVVMYVGPASSYTGKIFAGTISGSTITFGTIPYIMQLKQDYMNIVKQLCMILIMTSL